MEQKKEIRAVMAKAIAKARETMNQDIGGPFGAAIIDASGKIIAIASNSVLHDQDPTAHAEINAIRAAGKALGTHDLTGCIIVTTTYPCPMCLAAILWANIKKVIYGSRPLDAEAIGFRDDYICEFIKNDLPNKNVLEIEEGFREECLELFSEYQEKQKTLY
jgi:guanine deaminase